MMATATNIDFGQVERAIGFHGQPMQKIWEGERGDITLPRGDFKPDFSVYQSRQKHFVFQERAKRHKLHQFLARKANILYRKSTKFEVRQRQLAIEKSPVSEGICSWCGVCLSWLPFPVGFLFCFVVGVVAVTQPFDTFFTEKVDKSVHLQHIYSVSSWF